MSTSSGLTTGASSGSQSTTQSPQISSGQASNLAGGSQITSLQPDVAGSALTSYSGITLDTTSNLPAISLATASTQSSDTTTPKTAHHSINAGWLSISIVLFLVAVALFVLTSRSAKSTTNLD